MISVEVNIDINHPASKTFAFIANPENNPQWQKGMKQCTVTSGGHWGMGSKYEQVAEFMGKPILTSFEITAFEPGHLIKGESIISTFPITFTRIVDGNNVVTRVRAIVTGDPGGVMKLIPFFTRRMIRRSISNDYHTLKALLENPNGKA